MKILVDSMKLTELDVAKSEIVVLMIAVKMG